MVLCQQASLEILDPYNFSEFSNIERAQELKKIQETHLVMLLRLKKSYFDHLYASYQAECPYINLSIRQPPDLPPQHNSYDCGVFLAMFVFYLIHNKSLDFDDFDVLRMRETMRVELIEGKILAKENHGKHKFVAKETEYTSKKQKKIKLIKEFTGHFRIKTWKVVG